MSDTAPAASKNTARLKNGQNQPKNNHLVSLIKIHDTHCMYPIFGSGRRENVVEEVIQHLATPFDYLYFLSFQILY